MTTALEGSEGSTLRSGRSLPPGKNRYPLYRRLGGPQGRSGRVRKISPPPPHDILSTDRPAGSQSLYRLSYPESRKYTLSFSVQNWPSSLREIKDVQGKYPYICASVTIAIRTMASLNSHKPVSIKLPKHEVCPHRIQYFIFLLRSA
jgi:hypothetical protein